MALIGTIGSTIAKSVLPAGSVLQVVQGVKTDTFSTSSEGVFVDVTGLSVSITPSSSSSKVLVLCSVALAYNNNGTADRYAMMSLFRGSTNILTPTSPSNRSPVFAAPGEYGSSSSLISYCFQYLDSPASTSSLSYNIKVFSSSGSGVVFINRSEDDSDTLFKGRSVSTLTAMEIAA
jgi:hypothetical protein